jgi:hypothetical protein
MPVKAGDYLQTRRAFARVGGGRVPGDAWASTSPLTWPTESFRLTACTTPGLGEGRQKAEVQKRFDAGHGDFIARIADGTVQVHGKVPSSHECMQEVHRRAW